MLTGLLITILILAGAITAVGGGFVIARRRRELPGSSGVSGPKLLTDGSGKLIERTIRDLRAGDILSYEGKDFLVEGVVGYDEDGHRWSAGRIVDGGDERWVVVGLERGPSLTTRVMREDRAIEMSGYPPEELLVGDARFTMDRRGTATCKLSGETGALAAASATGGDTVARCRWWLYRAPGDDAVIVEQWGADFRVLRGSKVGAGLMELMPGS